MANEGAPMAHARAVAENQRRERLIRRLETISTATSAALVCVVILFVVTGAAVAAWWICTDLGRS
jgi:putative copper export protein